MTLDLTGDDFLGVAREEFVKSIKQFLKVEAEMYPVFIISKPGSECVLPTLSACLLTCLLTAFLPSFLPSFLPAFPPWARS